MADYAIHDTTLIGTSNIIRKKEGSYALIDPADYPKRINLMGMLEEKTATGSIVTFSDGADDVPLKSCEVALSPSLDGYSSVDVVSAGKNLVDLSSLVDGYVNSNGTFNTNHPNGEMRSDFIPVLPNTVYYFSIVETTGTAEAWVGVGEYTDTNTSSFVKRDGYWRFTTSATTKYMVVSARNLAQATKIQLEIGNDPTTWEAYSPITTYTASLGRTIYGGSVDVVKGEGTDENDNDFTFEPVEISSRLGNNTLWSDGDMTVVYRSSGTVTPIVPTLISKAITANGTYSAEDDDADGYDEVVVNVPSGLPSGDFDDFLDIQEDYTRYNVQNLYSSYYVENETLKRQIVFQLNTGSGYEGFCVSLDGLGLTEGQTYTLSFVLDVPSTVTFSGSYQWGMKHSTARLPASGSANSNTFNVSADVNFVEQTGTQNVSITFTAGATNYLIVLLARIASSRTEWLKMRDVQIEEVTAPSLLSMMPSEEVNENTEEVEKDEQNDIEG